MTGTAGLLQTLLDIFVSPREALARIREHTNWLWAPFVIMIIAAAAVLGWYYATVDFSWLVDRLIAMQAGKLEPAQAEAMRQHFTRPIMMGTAIAGAILGTALFYLVQAVYLFLVDKVTNPRSQGFGQWFSFTAWTYFPNLLAWIATAAFYATASNHQVDPYQLNVITLNNLFFHVPAGNPWHGWLNALNLATFWILALMTVGLRVWTGRSIAKSALIATIPYIVVYGIWATIILV